MGLLARTGWLLYQGVMGGGMLLAAPFLLARRGAHYLPTLRGRLGLEPAPASRGAIWIHAVSVGEVAVAAILARALPADRPLVVTTVTPTGQRRAEETFAGKAFAGRRVAVAYLPFDLGFAVGKFFDAIAPSALVLVEGDYWPLVLREAARRRVPVAVVNARVGERSGARLRRIPRLGRRLFFDPVARFGVQTQEDRRRLIAAGAEPARIVVTGNLKFEAPEPPAKPELEAAIRSLAGGRPIVVAGSTMAGEEAQVLDAFARLEGEPAALLVIAPRHPERWDEVAALLDRRGLAWRRRSALDDAGADDRAVNVLLLDSLGELAALYRVASVAFIGGTLVPTGGHNPLEPALFAVPTVVGPSMENFREIAQGFDAAGAWRRARDAGELAAAWREWLADPEAARAGGRRAAELLAANRGALDRTLELLRPIFDSAASGSTAGESASGGAGGGAASDGAVR